MKLVRELALRRPVHHVRLPGRVHGLRVLHGTTRGAAAGLARGAPRALSGRGLSRLARRGCGRPDGSWHCALGGRASMSLSRQSTRAGTWVRACSSPLGFTCRPPSPMPQCPTSPRAPLRLPRRPPRRIPPLRTFRPHLPRSWRLNGSPTLPPRSPGRPAPSRPARWSATCSTRMGNPSRSCMGRASRSRWLLSAVTPSPCALWTPPATSADRAPDLTVVTTHTPPSTPGELPGRPRISPNPPPRSAGLRLSP